MPFKVFAAGEEATASDINSYLAGQTVPRFTNAIQRTSQLASPALDQLSMLDSRPGIVQYWTGSAWVDIVGAPFVQAGAGATVIDGNSSSGITFPTPFAAPPIVVCCHQFAPIADNTQVAVNSVAAGSVYLRFFNGAGTPLPISSTAFYAYIAVGTRP
jgi:hypothetical protein